MTQTMTLSEAIRLGAMLSPQGFSGTSVDGRCALASAADACGIPDLAKGSLINYKALKERFPVLVDEMMRCPVARQEYCLLLTREVMGIIYHLNDVHRWTREAIADWVETLEQHQQETVDVPVMVGRAACLN